MLKKPGVIALLLLFFAGAVLAEDTNVSSEPSPEELQQMITDLRAEVQAARSQVITVHIDQDTQRLLQTLEDKIIAVEQKLARIEERFLVLKSDITDKIDSSQKTTVSKIESVVNEKIDAMAADIKENTKLLTNPVRINLPNFGLWMMVTAAFMLFTGLRHKTAATAAEREKKEHDGGGK